MKIPKDIMSAAIKDFKEFGTLTYPLLIRRLKVNLDMAKAICEVIAKRYPNLWANREKNREKKWIEGMKP